MQAAAPNLRSPRRGARRRVVGRAATAACAASLLGLLAFAAPSRASGLPLVFEADPAGTRFVTERPGCSLAIDAGGARIALTMPGATTATIRTSLPGADPSAVITGEDAVPGGSSRFTGSDPSKWRSAIPTFHRLRTRGVYPGIDMVWHGRDSALEYDFVVAPGADASTITIHFDGAASLHVDEDGDLVVDAGGRTLRWKKPVSWQERGGGRVEVASRYRRIAGDRFGFEVGAHDASLPLVIDPVLSYSTYVAQASFTAGDGLQNHGLAIVADRDGNAYVAGVTESSGYPVTASAYDKTRAGKGDLFVAKVAPAGDKLLWATYLGGAEAEVDNNRSADIAIDAAGNVYVTGSTKSSDFPTTAGAADVSLGGTTDAFVAKIAAGGASLAWSTYLGGSGVDRGWGIAVDGSGRVHVGGETNGGFPTTAGAYQTASDNLSAFAVKLADDGASLLWSTTVGRSVGAAHDLAIDAQGAVYLTGTTSPGNGVTSGFPVTNGAYQTTAKGSFDAFVTKVKSDGSALVWSTLLGGTSNEDGHAIAVDSDGKVYVTGATYSTNFPTTSGAWQSSLQSPGLDDAFVAKLDAAGASLLYGTYLGGDSIEDPADLVVDGGGNALLTGSTFSSNFPTTADALQKTMSPGPVLLSAFAAKVSSTGGLSYSTLDHPVVETPGGSSVGYGIALDGNGAAYVTGTASDGLPTTAGVFQASMYTFGTSGPFVTKLGGIATPTAKATVCGDFNGDGKVTASDSLGALKTAVGSGTCALKACDFNGDGKITAADALGVLRTAVGQGTTPKCPAA